MDNAEQYLYQMIKQFLNEPQINGTKLNQHNLDKLNHANVLIATLFGERAKKIEFKEPKNTEEFCSTFVIIEDLIIESKTDKERFGLLLNLVDNFYVSSMGGKNIILGFYVNNIWEE
jgi:hypothetical protein